MLTNIAFEQTFLALPRLPRNDGRLLAYGARSVAAVYVGQLLSQEVPAIAGGDLEIVAIARRPGVLSKVAVRGAENRPAPLSVGIGADHIARVRDALDGERIQVVLWQRTAAAYIADALGLAETPPTLLLPAIAHARVLLGEIDVRGLAGWRGVNVILASALTGWRIRLEPVAHTAAWASLSKAMATRRAMTATVVGRTERGVRIDVLGLNALVTDRRVRDGRISDVMSVRITRMDADEGRIFAVPAGSGHPQLVLPLT